MDLKPTVEHRQVSWNKWKTLVNVPGVDSGPAAEWPGASTDVQWRRSSATSGRRPLLTPQPLNRSTGSWCSSGSIRCCSTGTGYGYSEQWRWLQFRLTGSLQQRDWAWKHHRSLKLVQYSKFKNFEQLRNQFTGAGQSAGQSTGGLVLCGKWLPTEGLEGQAVISSTCQPDCWLGSGAGVGQSIKRLPGKRVTIGLGTGAGIRNWSQSHPWLWNISQRWQGWWWNKVGKSQAFIWRTPWKSAPGMEPALSGQYQKLNPTRG